MKRINMSFRNLIDFSDIPAKEWRNVPLAADENTSTPVCKRVRALATLFMSLHQNQLLSNRDVSAQAR